VKLDLPNLLTLFFSHTNMTSDSVKLLKKMQAKRVNSITFRNYRNNHDLLTVKEAAHLIVPSEIENNLSFTESPTKIKSFFVYLPHLVKTELWKHRTQITVDLAWSEKLSPKPNYEPGGLLNSQQAMKKLKKIVKLHFPK
jgi:hypothetical protein